MATVVVVNGNTVDIERGSLDVMDTITERVDTVAFSIADGAGTLALQVGQTISITVNSLLVFTGFVSDFKQRQMSYGKYAYDINGVDSSNLLQRTNVIFSYANMTAGDIVKSLIQNYSTGLGPETHGDWDKFIFAGPTIPAISFNWQFPFDCIEKLAQETQYYWYVDVNKYVHFFDVATNPAPYELNDDAVTSGHFQGLEISVDKSQLRNQVTVLGATTVMPLYTQLIRADGVQTSFLLDYTPTENSFVVSIGGVSKTVGTYGFDHSGYDFVLERLHNLLYSLDIGTLSAGTVLTTQYTWSNQIFAQAQNNTSIGLFGVLEGPLITDESIGNFNDALARCNSELFMYAMPVVKGSFTTTQSGYHSGQILNVNLAMRGFTEQFLIYQVEGKSIANGVFEYNITFSTRLKGLVQYLMQLFDRDQIVGLNATGETVYLYKQINETITLTEAVPTATLRNPSTTAYVYSNDAETTPNRGYYGLATYA